MGAGVSQLSDHQIVKRAENALRELELGVSSAADRKRCAFVAQGMHTLDREQCDIKNAIASLLDSLETGYTVPEVIEDLRGMVKRWDQEQASRPAARSA